MSVLTPNTVPDAAHGASGVSLPDYSAYLHVVAAVIEDRAGRILLARRPQHLHQGGLWEFPGGKVEAGEPVRAALLRELGEELGIRVTQTMPLIRIPYRYPDRQVLLDVWRVTAFDNHPHGAEGQEIRWVEPEALPRYEFPAANAPIVSAAILPSRYLITPDPGEAPAWPVFLERLEQAVENGIRLVQFRAKSLDERRYRQLAREVIALGRRTRVRVLLNALPVIAASLQADGVHLSSPRLMSLRQRPLDTNHWVAASCHNLAELNHAMAIGVDFVVASPVKVTASHPDATAIGWDGFRLLTEHAGFPVYALGGMGEVDLDNARKNGGQGIAAIRALWPQSA
jgi:8-oxo-dGTP diphosphatase